MNELTCMDFISFQLTVLVNKLTNIQQQLRNHAFYITRCECSEDFISPKSTSVSPRPCVHIYGTTRPTLSCRCQQYCARTMSSQLQRARVTSYEEINFSIVLYSGNVLLVLCTEPITCLNNRAHNYICEIL